MTCSVCNILLVIELPFWYRLWHSPDVLPYSYSKPAQLFHILNWHFHLQVSWYHIYVFLLYALLPEHLQLRASNQYHIQPLWCIRLVCTNSTFKSCRLWRLVPGFWQWNCRFFPSYFMWAGWHWDRFFSPQYFSCSLSVSYHKCSILVRSLITDVM